MTGFKADPHHFLVSNKRKHECYGKYTIKNYFRKGIRAKRTGTAESALLNLYVNKQKKFSCS